MSICIFIAADVFLDEIKNPHDQQLSINAAEMLKLDIPFQLKEAKIDPDEPNVILRIDIYPDECDSLEEIQLICKTADLPIPQEQMLTTFQWAEDDEPIRQLQLYWDLENNAFCVERLLQEIIKADIGGYRGFVSNVYFSNTHHFLLFHLYDDRGADLVAANRKLLRPIYEKYNDWILDYDRAKIDGVFAKRA